MSQPLTLSRHETCPTCESVLLWANGALVCPRRNCPGSTNTPDQPIEATAAPGRRSLGAPQKRSGGTR